MALGQRLPYYAKDPQYSGYGAVGTAGTNRLQGLAGDAMAQGVGSQQAQGRALGLYEDAAMGNGPSAAQAQLQQGTDASIAAARGLAASGQGGNLAGAARQGTQVASAMGQAATTDAAMLRAQEQQAAMAGFAQQGNTMAGQSLEEQLAYEQMLAGAQTADMNARNQFAQGQRAMDLEQREGNRRFGMGLAKGLGGSAANAASMGSIG